MKISQMPQSTTPSSDDVLAMLEGGTVNKKITLGDVGDWVNREHEVSSLETESKNVAGAINEIGTEVTELKNDLNDRIVDVGTGVVDFDKSISWKPGWINTTGLIASSTASQFALVPMIAGETIIIGTRNSSITIIGSTTANDVNIDDTVTVIKTTTASNTFQTYTYTATAPINIVICVRASEYSLVFKKQAPFMELFDNKQDKLTFDTEPIEGSNNPVESNGVFVALDEGELQITKSIIWKDGYVDTTGNIISSTLSGFCIVQMQPGEKVTIGTNNPRICIIGSTTASNVDVGDTITVIQNTLNTNTFQTYTYTAEKEINIVLCVKKSNYSCIFSRQANCYKTIENEINSFKSAIDEGYYNIYVVTNGSFIRGGGPTDGTANRIRTNLLEFKKGDKIKIQNGSLRHVCGMWNGTPSSDTNTRNDSTFIATDETIIPDYNGYIVIVFANSDNSALTPSDYDGEIRHYCTLAYQIENNEEEANIPEYFLENDYITNKAERINELGKAGDDVFVFISDMHWEKNAKNSPGLVSYLSKNCIIPRLFDGGDVADSVNMDAVRAFEKQYPHRIYRVVGNHDWFYPETGKSLYYWYNSNNYDQVSGNAYMHYWYVDNVQAKIRYVILNSFEHTGQDNTTGWTYGYGTEQIAWFTNEALNVDPEWDVIVFTHYIKTSGWLNDGNLIGEAIDSYNADTSHTGKVLAVFQGHTHWDGVYHTAGGTPIITITCDKWDLSNESYIIPEEGIAFRTVGTIKEQAFDVVILNRAEKKFNCVRIGAPAQDNVDKYRTDPEFTWIGTLQEREISYSV